MTYRVLKPFKAKTGEKVVEFKEGQVIKLPEQSAQKLIGAGKIEPQISYELAERMAIMDENCEPDQVKPYITNFGVLVIPYNSPAKYHYWKPGGQSICATLKELGRCDLIEKYTHPDYFNGN
ncbi:MAG: hypothetical protein DWB56_13985 [Candidatus Jettenia sp.]|uniref:Uncharacterized protein n=1 Tax=Candidatus Jettenia caeni TaxID=247490 RepID=I3IHS6_9BACT|nr:hypothetical protein [Candidatus Jettenia sp. AMX1]MBC6930045.1 hypothetical protein [Candidatus Jettenia sp.]WKZ16599.1 MAG: hypothetical protein QY317_04665 [Candidatus Jettenia caeni]KAA0248314.1 MAG: hypothetical protein EDM77_12765 [Candidatus Jettenia sp. AMX1]MCE7881701.1 hypothetical protein [Candidatus Jettenia sp. AMX1]MCQ3928317.1 hypothetical protein [Candidatus Jettenia sp.]